MECRTLLIHTISSVRITDRNICLLGKRKSVLEEEDSQYRSATIITHWCNLCGSKWQGWSNHVSSALKGLDWDLSELEWLDMLGLGRTFIIPYRVIEKVRHLCTRYLQYHASEQNMDGLTFPWFSPVTKVSIASDEWHHQILEAPEILIGNLPFERCAYALFPNAFVVIYIISSFSPSGSVVADVDICRDAVSCSQEE